MAFRYDSSPQSQNQISQAQNSLEKLHYAVSQAMSHPNAEMVEQAKHRLAHTEQAVNQTGDSLNRQPVELVEEMLEEEKNRLASISSDKQGEQTK
ncbi:hypothetical protein [Paenibacillus sp.]|jgi:TRAP-type mannitol/chloroaromatic compound transport system substrate-binding protein|uniref:hypothetical protein n=1 Tax=Paenibacillus sp. TaxID=58172 RepID=UPI002823984D|nr:hypothetical protein [Paenibacillus sp.]MDR0270598.1 hypothetical protein [Paenibacillus sp.]